MNRLHLVIPTVAALVAVAVMLDFPAGGQPPSAAQPAGTTVVVEARGDGALVERTLDGKTLRTYQGRLPAGGQNTAAPRVEYRQEEFIEQGPDGRETRRFVQVPVVVRGGGSSPYGSGTTDAESQK